MGGPINAVPLILYLMYFSSKCHEDLQGRLQTDKCVGKENCGPSVPSAFLLDLLLVLYFSYQCLTHQTHFIFYSTELLLSNFIQ